MPKPDDASTPNDWHQFKFDLSVDIPVNWERFDIKRWAEVVAKYTAIHLALTQLHPDATLEDVEPVKALIMNMTVDRVSFIDDKALHDMIDKTLEE